MYCGLKTQRSVGYQPSPHYLFGKHSLDLDRAAVYTVVGCG